MLRIIALFACVTAVAGCVPDRGTRLPLALDSLAMTQMSATVSVLEKRSVAARSCRRAGYRSSTDPYYDCMRALIARDLQRMRERTEKLYQHAADRRGVCLDRSTFEISRCVEI